MSQILVLLFVARMTSYVSAQQPNQRPRSERHLDPSGFPYYFLSSAFLELMALLHESHNG